MTSGTRAERLGWPIGVVCSFAARGLHSVIFPWLLLAAPGASGLSIGQVQGAALAAQAGALVLLGGAGARLGARRLAVLAQLAACLPPLLLALADPRAGRSAVLGYALASGALWGVISPARDSLVARGRAKSLLRPTTGYTVAQFGGLLGGIALAAAAEAAGASWLLAGQGLLHVAAAAGLAGAAAPAAIPAAPERRSCDRPGGERCSAREPILLAAVLGLCSAGPFTVWAPLWAEVQGAPPARALGLLLALFPLGTIAGSLALRAAGPLLSKRRTLFAANAAGSLSIAAAGLADTFLVAVVCIALWGVCGGIAINCGRALLLEGRPPAQHGRLLANLQLALLLASPVGAVLGGATASGLGVRGSMEMLGLASLACSLAIALAGRRCATDGRPASALGARPPGAIAASSATFGPCRALMGNGPIPTGRPCRVDAPEVTLP